MIVPPEGAAGPGFSATHGTPADCGDCPPEVVVTTAVKYTLWSVVIPTAVGSKVTEVAEVEDTRDRSEAADRAGSAVQYAVYRTLPAAIGVPSA